MSTASFEDPFVKVWFDEQDPSAVSEGNAFYAEWQEHASAKHQEPTHFALHALRKLYPKHSVVMSGDYRLNLLAYPGVLKVPVNASPAVTNLVFVPLARNVSPRPGLVVDVVELGAFHVAWQRYDFILYLVKCPVGGFGGYVTQSYLIHDGPESPARALLTEVGIWNEALHNEIWVFNQGFWSKNSALWQEAQKANWDDVILKEDFKAAFRKDIYGFFDSEKMYKNLAIPWKRGIIMFGPPGNGKTISIKAIIKECDAKGLNPLYVKSFHSWMGDEGSMAAVFAKARQLSPCVLILEDLDSLIDDSNRSFFLNQLDGLEGNDGLLVIGTTNHFERLDPGLSTRPSRFDRKFLFDDPDQEERTLYAKYWQNKLESNQDISFPDELVTDVAVLTDQFSFAYLKEAFVSSLVTLAGIEKDKPSFETVIKSQIKTLRKQLDKPTVAAEPVVVRTRVAARAHDSREPSVSSERLPRNIRDLVDSLANASVTPFQDGLLNLVAPPPHTPEMPDKIRDLLDKVADASSSPVQELVSSYLSAQSATSRRPDPSEFQDILDKLSAPDVRVWR